MINRLPLLLSLCALVACAVPAVRDTLPVFNGKSVDFAMSYLGVPDRQYKIDGNDIYEWDNSSSKTYSRPVANFGFGVGGASEYGVGMGFPLGGYETETYSQSCKIKLIVHNRIVQGHEFAGDDNGCRLYAKRLKPLTDSLSQ